MAWGSEGSPHVCFRFVWYTCVIFIPVHFQKEYSSRKETPVLHTAYYWPRIPVHLQDNAKSSASNKAEEMWGTEKEFVAVTNCPTRGGSPFFWPASLLLAGATYPPSHLHTDLRALPWLVSNQKNEENAKAQSPFFVIPLWCFQSCNQVIIAWWSI